MSLGRYIATNLAVNAALDAVPAPIVAGYDAIGYGRQFSHGARQLTRGVAGVTRVAGRGRAPTTMVAGEFFHGPGDRSAAIAKLTTDFVAFQNDLAAHALRPDDARWAIDAVLPVLVEWKAFTDKVKGSEIAPWITEWSVLENWQDRLVRLRELARVKGIALDSPPPVPLPETVWQRGAAGAGSSADVALGLLRWGVYAALGVLGAASLYTVIRDVQQRVSAP